MRNSHLAMLLVAGMLAACGGGGSGSGNGAAQLPAGPKTYTAAKATAGDYYVFQYVYREQGSSEETQVYSTRLVSNVASNGTVSIKYLEDSQLSSDPLDMGSRAYSADFDGLGRWLGSSNWSCGISSNPPMYTVAPLTLAVGMNWEYSGVGSAKCSNEAAVQTTLRHRDTAVALEQVTVAAGTFNTIKVNRSAVEEDDNFSYAAERSCWWEPDLGIEVKCATNETITNKTTGVKTPRYETRELQGYSTQQLGRRNDAVQRFAGNWTGQYSGRIFGADDKGSCSFTFDLAGNVKGSCSGAAVGFSVTGKVSAAGQLTLNMVSGNANWTAQGKMDSIEQASGTWEAPSYGSGTWLVTQD